MVGRMMRRGALAAPAVLAGLWAWDGGRAALSGAVGLGLALLNLWLAARVIGGVADTSPHLLLLAAMVAFALGLGLLTGIAFALQAAGVVSFPVTGWTLIGAHLGLVLWEAGRAFPVSGAGKPSRDGMLKTGSRPWS